MKVLLDRWQFGVTITYHFLFVPLTIGLALLVAVMQVLAYRRRDEVWEQLTRFFGTLFLINYAMGVVTGIVQEFQFGIVVDDGLATGSSMRAAVEALRRLQPAAMGVAVPAAPESTCRELDALAEEVVCATTPSPFFAVGESYWDFTQTTDEEVRDLFRAAPGSRAAAGG